MSRKKITPAEEARYIELAERMEAGDFGPIPAAPSAEEGGGLAELLAEFDALELIESDEPTPVAPAEAVTAAEVASKLGRPSLSGTVGTGRSRRRQTRLPMDLDALLEERIAQTHRGESEILRDALEQYLHAS